jgi:hypothetical protein
VDDDGEYGPVTARAVAGWKRARGARSAAGELDPLGRRRLLGDMLLRAARLMERWAIACIGEEPVGSTRVAELVSLAERLEVRPEFSGMGYPWCAFAALLAAPPCRWSHRGVRARFLSAHRDAWSSRRSVKNSMLPSKEDRWAKEPARKRR